jgi:hypothetical protein
VNRALARGKRMMKKTTKKEGRIRRKANRPLLISFLGVSVFTTCTLGVPGDSVRSPPVQ